MQENDRPTVGRTRFRVADVQQPRVDLLERQLCLGWICERERGSAELGGGNAHHAIGEKSSAIPVDELGHLPSYRETNRSVTDFKDALQHDTHSYWEARHAEDQASRCLVGSEYADE